MGRKLLAVNCVIFLHSLSTIIELSQGLWCHECVFVSGVTDRSCLQPKKEVTGVDCTSYNEPDDSYRYDDVNENVTFEYCEIAEGYVDNKFSFHRGCSAGPLIPGKLEEKVDGGFTTDGNKIKNLTVIYCTENNLCNNKTMSGGIMIGYSRFLSVIMPFMRGFLGNYFK